MTAFASNKLGTREPVQCCGNHGSKRGFREQEPVPKENPAIAVDVTFQRIGVRPIFFGIIAALAVVGFYLGLLTITSDWFNARAQFEEYRWWIVALSLGLGTQAALFSFMRIKLIGRKLGAAKSGLAASGGMSTASMAACCAHYLVPLAATLGVPFLSTAIAGIASYQTALFLFGVLSNLAGLGIMLRLMQKNGILKWGPGIQKQLGKCEFSESREVQK